LFLFYDFYNPELSDLNNKNPNIARPIQQAKMKQEKIIVVTHLSNTYLFSKPLAYCS
jgi:hypothetical protein